MNGLANRDGFRRKGSLLPGDALILAKPIGTGTLLAADIRGLAMSRWVQAAIRHMITSNRRAGAVSARHGVYAATDVTGFGQPGHLVEIIKASGVDVRLQLDSVPVLDGAREAAAGALSSLQPANVRLRRAISALDAAQRLPLYPLLFDPQTAGGLPAGIPTAKAGACVAALRAEGYAQADIIGEVLPPTDALEPISLQ